MGIPADDIGGPDSTSEEDEEEDPFGDVDEVPTQVAASDEKRKNGDEFAETDEFPLGSRFPRARKRQLVTRERSPRSSLKTAPLCSRDSVAEVPMGLKAMVTLDA